MKNSKPQRVFLTMLMAFLISNIPNVVLGKTIMAPTTQMISVSAVLADVTRADAEKNVKKFIDKSEVQSALIRNGISPDEATRRLALLSEREVRDLSGQVYEARAGGDILVAVLLVVLIIYFAQRI